MRSSKALREGFECCLGPRLLNPVEDWVGNWADPLNTRGLKKLAELSCVRRGDTLVFFVLLWECKASLSLVPPRGRGIGFGPGRDHRERGKGSGPISLPVSSSSSPDYRPSIDTSLQKQWLWGSEWINVCRRVIPNAEQQCRGSQDKPGWREPPSPPLTGS